MSDGGDLHPGFSGQSPAPTGTPAPPPPELGRPASAEAPVDRTRGHSPALDQRRAQQQQGAEQQTIKVGDVEYTADQVNEAIRFKAEQDVRKSGLPPAPDKYETKLPTNFQAPEGVKFEFDQNDPALAEFRKVAHARGLTQDDFSDYLGVYAATKISEQTRLAAARDAELAKLGSAAPNRVAAVQTWLKARVGADADVLVSQLAKFPHARMVTTFEKIMRAFSGQGGAEYSQGGRSVEDNTGKIAGYSEMSFAEKRAAQMARDPRIAGSLRTSQGRGE